MSSNKNRYSSSPMYGPEAMRQTRNILKKEQPAEQAQPVPANNQPYQQPAQQNVNPAAFNGADPYMQQAYPQQPVYGQPAYNQPVQGMPVYNQPAQSMPVYNQPAYVPYAAQPATGPRQEPGYRQQAFLQEQAAYSQMEAMRAAQAQQQYQQPQPQQQPAAQIPYTYAPQANEPPLKQQPRFEKKLGNSDLNGPLWLLIAFTVGLPLLFLIAFILVVTLKGTLMQTLPCLIAALVIGGFIGVMYLLKAFNESWRKRFTYIYCAFILILIGMFLISTVANGCSTSNSNKQPVPVDVTQQPAVIQVTNEPTATANTTTSAAKHQLELFMSKWAQKQYADCIQLCRPDWVTQQQNAEVTLFHKLGDITPLQYSIEKTDGSEADSSRTITMLVKGKVFDSSDVYYRYTVLMLKVNSTWYIDPDSLSGVLVTVEALQAEGKLDIVTPAPTPTPKPTANPNMILYYNPNGGSYYHIDKQCTSMDSTARRALQQFYYFEVNNDQYKALSPCTKCGSPARQTN